MKARAADLWSVFVCATAIGCAWACSSDPDDPGGDSTGGVSGTGGTTTGGTGNGGTANGGTAPSSGGTTPSGTGGAGGGPGATGGATNTGGSVATGGAAATGGAPASGGTPSSGGTATTGGATASGGTPSSGGSPGTLPPVTSVNEKGPYAVTVDQNAGANSWVFRPTDLGKDGVKHPIFVWGTGATSVPSQYTDHLTMIASHGIVCISPNSSSVSAALLKGSLDWILAQNDAAGSVYQGKLNTGKVAMGGHSLGSIGTFNQEATESRLTTTIHIAGGSFDGQGSSKVKTPTAYICGASGDIALPQCQVDFQNVKTQPTFYSELQNTGHVDAARKALPGMVAWLRWHLNGETERKALFTGPDGEFHKGIWKSQTKNW